MANPYLPIPFANTGTKTPISQNRNDGVVNLTQGYGDDYSRTLGTDPAAKPVERDFQNWLYNILTENMIEWQAAGSPTYLPERQYDVGAVIRYTSAGADVMRIFRCIARPPVGTIPTNVAFWEVVPTDAVITARIPMPNAGRVPTSKNWDELGVGTWLVDDIAMINTGINSPPTTGIGYLTVYDSATSRFQIYYARNNQMWTRNSTGGVWTGWVQKANSATTLAGYGIVDAVRAAGFMIPGTNFSTIRQNASWSVYDSPANWEAMGRPSNETGVFVMFGYSNDTVTIWSQSMLTSTGKLWTRVLNGYGSAWTEWTTTLTSVQQVLDILLPRNNTWTGINTWNGPASFGVELRSRSLNARATNTENHDSQDVGYRINNGADAASTWNWDLMMNRAGERGFYNRRRNVWEFRIASSDLEAQFYAPKMALNANQLANSGASLELRTSGGGALNPAISSRADGQIDISVINSAGTDLVNYNFDRTGAFSAPGQIRAGGNIQSGSAFMDSTGNLTGSSWGSNLVAYLNTQNRFVRSSGNAADIQLSWNGTRVAAQVGGTSFNFALPFIDGSGNVQLPNALQAAGTVFAGSAAFQTDANINGSIWGGYLSSFLNDQNRFVRNANRANDIRLYWDNGRMQFWTDGGYSGTPAMTTELSAYWPRGEFLRPDQGGWRGVGSSSGAFTIPVGGVWAYFLIGNDGSSNLTRAVAGVAPGGTNVSLADNRAGSALMWRIY